MITVLLIQFLVSVICLVSGFLFYHFIGQRQRRPLVFYCITGLIVITVITEIVALIMPVNALFVGTFLIVLTILSFICKNELLIFLAAVKNKIANTHYSERLAYLAAWMLFAYLAAGKIIMDDTESYHIQMVKWINEFGTVPGIANLHERYGFNSAWFSSVGFVNAFGDRQFYSILNSLLSVWFTVYLLRKFSTADSPGALGAAMLLLITLAFWPFLRGNAVNANYDFITTLIVTILVIESHRLKDEFDHIIPELIIWPAFLITVRLMNFPLLVLLFAGIIAVYRLKKGGFLTVLIVPAIIVIPFLIRNLMVSGYLFFPSTSLDLFHFDWKADSVMMEQLMNYIKYYNRVSTQFMDISETSALSNWIPAWFGHLYVHDKIIVATGSAGILISTINLFRGKISRPFQWVIITLICMLLSWFFIAPDPRFIYGGLFGGTYLLFCKVFPLINIGSFFRTRIVFVLFTVGIFGYMGFRIFKQNMTVSMTDTSTLPDPPVTIHHIDSITVYIPGKIEGNWNARCYGMDLPCVYEIDPRLEARGKSLKEGFRLKK